MAFLERRGRGSAIVLVGMLLVPAAIAHADQISVGDRLPALVLDDWQGHAVALQELRAPVLIIEFCASWCAPCREALPALRALADQFRDRGARLVAINIDRDRSAADRFVGRTLGEPLPITVLADAAGDAMARFGAPGMPSVYVVVDGVVRLVESGYSADKLAAIQHVVADALSAAPESASSATP